MAKLHGIQVNIATRRDGDDCLDEWIDPNHTSEPNTTLHYITVISNEPWYVCIYIPLAYIFKSDVLAFQVLVDGALAGETWYTPTKTWPSRPASTITPSSIVFNEGNPIQDVIQPILDNHPVRFPTPAVNQKDPGAQPRDDDWGFWEGREILVRVFPTRLHRDADHGFTSDHSITPAGDASDVLAFRFLPRPVSLLMRILHPTPPSPSPPLPSSPSALLAPRDVADSHCYPVNVEWKEQLPEIAQKELYCYCRRITGNAVVTCDNDACEIRWFHWACVGLKEQPTRFPWLCPECRVLPEEKLVSEGNVKGMDA